jgi:hypothetical protein
MQLCITRTHAHTHILCTSAHMTCHFHMFQRSFCSNLVLKTVKSHFADLNYYENGSTYVYGYGITQTATTYTYISHWSYICTHAHTQILLQTRYTKELTCAPLSCALNVCLCMYVYTYTSACTCYQEAHKYLKDISTHTCIHTHLHTYTHAYVYTYIHAYTHAYV